ncbi:MAG: methyltransferase family protein [Acidimicrobiales bacterium]
MTALETRVPPMVWALLAGLIEFGLSPVDSLLDASWVTAFAVVIAVAGIALSAAGIAEFGRAHTSVDPHSIEKASTLVTSGVYRVTRNPMYVGLLVLLVAFGLWRGSLAAVSVGPILFVVVMTRLQIIPEERMLGDKFGVAYDEFSESSRRWLW